MKKCSKCNFENEDNNNYCAKCGSGKFIKDSDSSGLVVGDHASISAHDIVGGNKETISGNKEVIHGNQEIIGGTKETVHGNKEEINAHNYTVHQTVIHQESTNNQYNDPEFVEMKKRREMLEARKIEAEIAKLEAEIKKVNSDGSEDIRKQQTDAERIARLEKELIENRESQRHTQTQIKQAQEQVRQAQINAQQSKATTTAKPYAPLYAPAPTKPNNWQKYIIPIGIVVVVGLVIVFVFSGKDDNKEVIVAKEVTTESVTQIPQTATPSTAVDNQTPSKSQTQQQPKAQPTQQQAVQSSASKPTQTESQQPAKAESQQPPAPKSPAELYQDGLNAYKKFNYDQAASNFAKSAEQGNNSAQYYLGIMYLEGNGVSKSSSTAFSYIQKAANGGHKDAIYQLAQMYHGGLGTEKDKSQARIWYQKAADMGNASAKRKLESL